MASAQEQATNLRKLAEDCRTMAAITKTPEIRTELTEMAERFERLAQLRQLNGQHLPKPMPLANSGAEPLIAKLSEEIYR